jgi:hypothetical protein
VEHQQPHRTYGRLKTFFSTHNIDVMLISETCTLKRPYVNALSYEPSNRNCSRWYAIIIKNSIEHHHSAVYLPPRYTIKQDKIEDFYNTLVRRFSAGGDYSAKRTDWGSRLITPRGRELLKSMESDNLKHIHGRTRKLPIWQK